MINGQQEKIMLESHHYGGSQSRNNLSSLCFHRYVRVIRVMQSERRQSSGPQSWTVSSAYIGTAGIPLSSMNLLEII